MHLNVYLKEERIACGGQVFPGTRRPVLNVDFNYCIGL